MSLSKNKAVKVNRVQIFKIVECGNLSVAAEILFGIGADSGKLNLVIPACQAKKNCDGKYLSLS